MTNQTLVKIVLDRWNASVKNFDELLDKLSDEQLQKEVSSDRNRGIYILGHIVAVHDNMLPLLNFGEKKYSDLNKRFIDEADKSSEHLPSAKELRVIWKEQVEEMQKKFETLKTEDWLEKHSSVSAEDFAKEPHRNKLNIVLTRTTHLAYHTGQMVFLNN